MKSTKNIITLGLILIGTSAFASPMLPDSSYVAPDSAVIVSGEAGAPNPPLSLNSAGEEPGNLASGEINLDIPFNPDEVDKPEAWTPDGPKNGNLNSASEVDAGPALNVAIALMLSLLISGYIYTRAKPHLN